MAVWITILPIHHLLYIPIFTLGGHNNPIANKHHEHVFIT